jgi:hypothetical protein
MTLLLLLSCNTTVEAESVSNVELLAPREQLIRLSVDLRGVHPGEESLAAIDANPELYEAFVDEYLADERYLDRMEEVFNLTFHTRTGATYFDPAEAGLEELPTTLVAGSVGDEPIKLVRHIVENDLPYSDIVTADYTMADPVLAQMWDLEYPDGEEGWQRSRYTDGRPHAGVLTMTTMWLRYPSSGANANRHRANAVSTILMCDDYLARPVSFSRSQIDALTTGDPEEVIRNSPSCQSCHSSMDPLAAHFFGFWWDIEEETLENYSTYRPEDETIWQDYADKEPGWHGTPTANLEDLGNRISEDPRFVDCAVQTVFEGITQRTTSDDDWEELAVHEDAFVANSLNIRELSRSIVMSEEYRAAKAFGDLEERMPTVKQVSPAQLAAIIEGKTGYRWEFNGVDGLTTHTMGLPVLAGGVDSVYVREPNYDPSVGLVFVQERLAQSAGWHVARHDLDPDREGDAILLKYVTVDMRPDTDEDAFKAQIEHLYRHITGIPLEEDDPQVDMLITVWRQLYSIEGDSEAAWAGLTSVVLRDPRVIFY